MSSPLQVIVDDRNTQFLTYEGAWDHNEGSYREYNTTTSRALKRNANATFAFNGTSVSVYGTLGTQSDGTTVEVILDGKQSATIIVPPNSPPPIAYHTQFYSIPDLSDGPHTLKLSVTEIGNSSTANETDSNWFFDYIIYTPSAKAPATSLGALGEFSIFDDTNPALAYSGPWSTEDGTQEDMQWSLHYAEGTDSSVSLQFTGTHVSVYGNMPFVSGITAVAEVVIDGGNPFILNYPSITDLPFDSDKSSNYRLYQNTTLLPGSHSIIITAKDKNAFWLDYITAGTGVDTSVANGGLPISQPPPSRTQAPGLQPSGTSSTGSKGASSSSKMRSQAAGIAGGVIGAACFLLLLWWLFVRRRQYWKRKQDQEMQSFTPYLYPNPGPLIPPGRRRSMNQLSPISEVREGSSVMLAMPYDARYSGVPFPDSSSDPGPSMKQQYTLTRREKSIVSSEISSIQPTTPITLTTTASAITPSSSSALTSLIPSVATSPTQFSNISDSETTPIQHKDSGVRGLSPVEARVELPPIYTPV